MNGFGLNFEYLWVDVWFWGEWIEGSVCYILGVVEYFLSVSVVFDCGVGFFFGVDLRYVGSILFFEDGVVCLRVLILVDIVFGYCFWSGFFLVF